MSVALVTGSASGIGRLTAFALARSGHTVYATVRSAAGERRESVDDLEHSAAEEGLDLRVIELDVSSQESADQAVATILERSGQLDVVVHNAGHLTIGYTEAFSDADVLRLFDVNAVGAHRVNRAVLPHLRARRSGTLIYVGSTTLVTTPPFMGPYVASKAGFDMLAVATSYETNAFGIETSIVLPGPFTSGTSHFQHADSASDEVIAQAYAGLDPLVARTEEATDELFAPGTDPDPAAVAAEIDRIVALPVGSKPFRSVVDFSGSDVPTVNDVTTRERERFVTRLGYGDLLTVETASALTVDGGSATDSDA